MAKVFPAQAIDRLEVTIGSKKLGEIFLELGYITRTKLDRALEYQRKKGGQLGWILAALGYISRLQLYEGLAKHLSLPFETNMEHVLQRIDRKLAATLTYEEVVKYQAVPFFIDNKTLYILTAKPNSPATIEFFKQKFHKNKASMTVVTDLDIMKLSGELYRDRILDTSINGLPHRDPEETARIVFTGEQTAFAAGFLCMLGVLLYFETESAILAMMFAVQFFFAVPILFKLALVLWGRMKPPAFTMNEAVKPYNEYDLPVYSILIAAYKEKAVIGNLIKCIKKFDYPEDKLDIILLLEEDDKATLVAAKAEKPPANWRFLVCPDSIPRTKSKALNYGLNFAKGEFITVYDAEDLPEPCQLKKAVTAFRTHPDDYICFQAALHYFNKNENFLTKMLTLENSSWNYGLLPGLFRMGLPVPLGGTSSHFDLKKLKKIGAWDAFNVTGDADLGIRATAEGYETGVIDSTTYEEATSQLKNWMKQRSRWVKGYLQTFLVYTRNPLKLIKSLGFFKWFGYTLFIGGTPAIYLLNPVMWVLLGLSIFLDVSGLFYVPSTLIYLTALNLIVGNIIVTFIAMLGALPRKNYGQIFLAVLSPVYWMLQSFAAYKGLWQLFFKPFYWEKTDHGLTKNIPVSRTLEIPENVSELVVVKNTRK